MNSMIAEPKDGGFHRIMQQFAYGSKERRMPRSQGTGVLKLTDTKIFLRVKTLA